MTSNPANYVKERYVNRLPVWFMNSSGFRENLLDESFRRFGLSKVRSSKANAEGLLSAALSEADLGRLLGRQMRKEYDASLPEGPLPDDLGRLIEKLQTTS